MIKNWIFIILLAAVAGFGTAGCNRASAPAQHSAGQKAKFHCPMHPTYVSDRPGDCPICGMRLVPIESDHAAPSRENPSADAATDRASVSLSQEKQQLIGMRTAPAERRDLEILIRASGRVAYDPDLYNAIIEYREAVNSKRKVAESSWPDVRERADALIKSSVLRLRQMGLSQAQIHKLGGEAEDPTNLLLGEKGGSVWVYAQIYEYEAGLVKAGQTMEVTSSANPGRVLKGRVVAVDSILDPETRTLRVRGEVQNPEDLLKPEMYVDAVIRVALGNKLAVPADAVLDSGTRKIVFVESAPGKFDPREITVGRKAQDHYEVVSGLQENEKVVVSANFLIDSESRLKAALSQTGSGAAPSSDGAHHH